MADVPRVISVLDAVAKLDELRKARDRCLDQRDFKGASERHFTFHQIVYAWWPEISRVARCGIGREVVENETVYTRRVSENNRASVEKMTR